MSKITQKEYFPIITIINVLFLFILLKSFLSAIDSEWLSVIFVNDENNYQNLTSYYTGSFTMPRHAGSGCRGDDVFQ